MPGHWLIKILPSVFTNRRRSRSWNNYNQQQQHTTHYDPNNPHNSERNQSKEFLQSRQDTLVMMQQEQQQHRHSSFLPQQPWPAEAVASLPPPGLSGPGQIVFSPSLSLLANNNNNNKFNPKPKSARKKIRYLAFVSSPSAVIRQARTPPPIFRPLTTGFFPTNKQQQQTLQTHQQTLQTLNLTSTTATTMHHQQPYKSHLPFQPPLEKNPTLTATQPTMASSTSTPVKQNIATHNQERILMCMDLTDITAPLMPPQPMLRFTSRQSKRRLLDSASSSAASSFSSNDTGPPDNSSKSNLEERIRRDKQQSAALSSGSLTQFSWTWCQRKLQESGRPAYDSGGTIHDPEQVLRILIPSRGNLYIQDGIISPPYSASSTPPAHENPYVVSRTNQEQPHVATNDEPRCIYFKSQHGASVVDSQLSPDGTMVAWVADGEIFVQSCGSNDTPVDKNSTPIQISFGAIHTVDTCIRHGIADFVAQEEMDRYRGYWWHPDSTGILFVRLDESAVPPFRILFHDASGIGNNHENTSSNNINNNDHHDPYHRNGSSAIPYEDHRYPFAGKDNPKVKLGYVQLDRDSILQNGLSQSSSTQHNTGSSSSESSHGGSSMEVDDTPPHSALPPSRAQDLARQKWTKCLWIDSPREASEYLARIHWLPDGSVAAQWQNRPQNVSVLTRIDLKRGKSRTLLTERSEVWINLHHMFRVLPEPVHPDDCIPTEKQIPPMPNPLPEGSFSFLQASERSGFQHLYLYTFCPGIHGEQAVPLRSVSSGEWMVESIVGVDPEKDVVYITGTFDSVLERHLYALPLLNRRLLGHDSTIGGGSSSHEDPSVNHNGVRRSLTKVMHSLSGKGRNGRVQEAVWDSMRPVRLTVEAGMHSIVMDDDCQLFVDTSSDLDRPTSSRIYELPDDIWSSATRHLSIKLIYTLFDAIHDDISLAALGGSPPLDGLPPGAKLLSCLPPPELISFPTSDGTETLHAALYRPDPRIYGPGPYPLVCAVYGGPHVQRVNRSWSQCADMRAQRLRSLGFCVVKCDNRGSSRRGMAFESCIRFRLGRLEVLDQVAAVRHLFLRGIADSTLVGVYGWSYGGYLAAMCLCRAPDVFCCAVSGAPVTSWDGYDTHYTERYMGHPSENGAGYRESAVFDHVPNMRGKIMIVHGLLDENVHFRHTARLINKLIAAGKDYDLLLFPEERHSPRRLRDRIYMEQKISDFFLRHLTPPQQHTLSPRHPPSFETILTSITPTTATTTTMEYSQGSDHR